MLWKPKPGDRVRWRSGRPHDELVVEHVVNDDYVMLKGVDGEWHVGNFVPSIEEPSVTVKRTLHIESGPWTLDTRPHTTRMALNRNGHEVELEPEDVASLIALLETYTKETSK